jgi:hypothetical protein
LLAAIRANISRQVLRAASEQVLALAQAEALATGHAK